ncbi:MAG TPA: SDR family oxidoreductase [Steroidobacteraceae bacterium]|nr:SDR family oxidoreductase [Steroidobacteraceae bacterium]
MLKGLQGKTVLVTGAAGGIGRATCDRLLAEGARVVAIDLDVGELRRALGKDAECLAADLTTPTGAAACVTAAERFGGLDLAFLNAGVEGVAANVSEFSEANYDHVFNINVRGSFLCAQAVVRHLQARGKGGGILFTASIAGLKCNPTTSVYNASKHAVVGLAKCLASEVGAKGIRVNVLCPGVVDTRMIHSLEESMGAASGVSTETMQQAMRTGNALGRYGTVDEIAAMAAWILSDEAPYCHGETFTIGGGLMAS